MANKGVSSLLWTFFSSPVHFDPDSVHVKRYLHKNVHKSLVHQCLKTSAHMREPRTRTRLEQVGNVSDVTDNKQELIKMSCYISRLIYSNACVCALNT